MANEAEEHGLYFPGSEVLDIEKCNVDWYNDDQY